MTNAEVQWLCIDIYIYNILPSSQFHYSIHLKIQNRRIRTKEPLWGTEKSVIPDLQSSGDRTCPMKANLNDEGHP